MPLGHPYPWVHVALRRFRNLTRRYAADVASLIVVTTLVAAFALLCSICSTGVLIVGVYVYVPCGIRAFWLLGDELEKGDFYSHTWRPLKHTYTRRIAKLTMFVITLPVSIGASIFAVVFGWPAIVFHGQDSRHIESTPA